MRKWGQNAKVLTNLKTLARVGVFKNSCETAAENSSEGATIVLFLMQLPEADAKAVATVNAPPAWFEKRKL